MSRHYRDFVIEDLALAEIDALDAAATWRGIARAALTKLHEQHVEIERLGAMNMRLQEEYRALRERLMREATREAA